MRREIDMPGVRITQVRSAVSRPKDQGRTLRALGLHRIRQSVEHEDRPEIRGMIRKVAHLVAVPELDGQPVRPTAHRRSAGGGGGA
jgi:large subunit ribosomal protein L30